MLSSPNFSRKSKRAKRIWPTSARSTSSIYLSLIHISEPTRRTPLYSSAASDVYKETDIIVDLDAQLTELQSEKQKSEEDLADLRKKHIEYILASDEYLSIETQKAEAPLRFATTKNAFIVEG